MLLNLKCKQRIKVPFWDYNDMHGPIRTGMMKGQHAISFYHFVDWRMTA